MLTVLTPAPSYDLVSLAAAKAEMEVGGTTDDAVISTLIRQASATISTYCQRVFPQETVTETFRIGSGMRGHRWYEAPLVLSRAPVSAVTAIIDNDVTLTPDAYELDYESGRLDRMAGVYSVAGWWGHVAVTYTGGYPPGEIPSDVERAALDMVKRSYYARSRDPNLRSEQILDVINQSFVATDFRPTLGGLPREVAERLSTYRRL